MSRASLAELRARVLADPALAAMLAALALPDALVDALRTLAPSLDPTALRDALALGRGARDVELPAHARTGWAPTVIERDGRVRWAHLAGAPLEGPFFEDDARRALARPLHRFVQPWSAVDGLERDPRALPIAGLVLHASRCGSTLVARVLAADARTRVVSEAAAIDGARTYGARALAAIVDALAVPSARREQRVVLKLDAWHALDVPLLREALGDVPMVFVTRDPLDILVSHARRRGRHVVPGTLDDALLPPAHPGEGPADLDAHAARVLVAIHQGIARSRQRGARIRVIDHAALPGAIASEVLPWLGQGDPDPSLSAAMLAVAASDAKSPEHAYRDDTEAKRAEATPRLRALADRVRPAYDALVASP